MADLKLKFIADTKDAAAEMKRLAGYSGDMGGAFDEVADKATAATDATVGLGNASDEAAEALRAAEGAADDAAQKIGDVEKAEADAKEEGSSFSDNFHKDMQTLGDVTDIVAFAMDNLNQAIATVSESADRLGRTEFSTALERAQAATQRLTDAMFELPIGKLVPGFQLLGDAELKNADAITILTRAFNAAGDGMNLVNAQLIRMRAEAKEISWEEAQRQIDELTGAVLTQEEKLFEATRATDAYSERWTALAEQVNAGAAAQDNWNQYMDAARVEEEAAQVEALANAQQALAAGLSGVLGNAQQEYKNVTAETSKEITGLQAELDKYTKLNGTVVVGVDGVTTTTLNYSKKIEELNGQIDAQTAKQKDAAEALQRTTAQFVFQQAAASLNAVQQTELAYKLGMIDEASYKASKAAQNLKDTYDTNKDGTVSAEEGADKYIEALSRLTTTIGNEATPAADDHKKTLEEAERATGTVADTLNNKATPAAHNNARAVDEAERATGEMANTLNSQATPAVNTLRESTNNASTSLATAKTRAEELQEIIDQFESQTFTYTFNFQSGGGTGPGGGGGGGGGGEPMAPMVGSTSMDVSAPAAVGGAGGNVYNFYLSDWPELEERVRALIRGETAQAGTQADFRSRNAY